MSLGYWETLITQQSDGPALTAAAAASLLPPAAKKTLPPNFFDVIGKELIIEASGRITAAAAANTMRFRVLFGAIAVFDGLAILLDPIALHTNVGWKLRIELSCRIIGTAAQLHGDGEWICESISGVPATAPKGVLVAKLPWNASPGLGTAFDSIIAHVVDLEATPSAATGSIQQYKYRLISPN